MHEKIAKGLSCVVIIVKLWYCDKSFKLYIPNIMIRFMVAK